MIFKDGFLSLNGTNVSSYLQSLELPLSRETQDDTAMGDLTSSNAPGLKTWQITANFHQSFVDNELDETLFGLYDAGTIFAVIARPTSSAVGASNPQFTGNGFISEYTPLTGEVGSQLVVPITIVAAGNLSRGIV